MEAKVVIPSRYASSRLPGKPLVDLCGLPMIARVYQRVVVALPSAECVVATDDARISATLTNYNIPWVMTSTVHQSGTDRIAEVCQLKGWSSEAMIINVQGDEPLVPTAMLREFARIIEADNTIQMATISAPVVSERELFDSNIVKLVCDQKDNAIYFSRYGIPFKRDGDSKTNQMNGILRHIGVYGYRVKTLCQLASTPPVFLEEMEKLEQLRALWLGLKVRVLHWHSVPPHGVDTMEDAERVREVLGRNLR